MVFTTALEEKLLKCSGLTDLMKLVERMPRVCEAVKAKCDSFEEFQIRKYLDLFNTFFHALFNSFCDCTLEETF